MPMLIMRHSSDIRRSIDSQIDECTSDFVTIHIPSRLHAPPANRLRLDQPEQAIVDEQSDEDSSEQPGKDVGDLKRILILEDVPSESTRAGRDTEDQLGRDQRAPCE